jgi:integrase/recombinase XerD
MENTAQIIQFKPKQKSPKASRKIRQPRNPDTVKYFTKQQIQLLRRTVRNQAKLAAEKKNVTNIREWLAIDILTCTGLRVAEVVDLRCGDFKLGYGEASLTVRNGKGSKSRNVEIPAVLKRHLKDFISWKSTRGEATGHDSYLFIGQRGNWSPQAVQQLIKKYLKKLGLYEKGKSVHALRHSYAVEFYRKEKDLRALQRQLGHSTSQVTEIYASVLTEDIQRQLKNLWSY